MSTPTLVLAFFSMPQGTELLVILAIGLLLFGRKLPEVGRSLGRSIVEFKKGIKGIEDDIDRESASPSNPRLAERGTSGSGLPARSQYQAEAMDGGQSGSQTGQSVTSAPRHDGA